MVCIGHHVGGHALALQHGGQNYFLLISCSTFHSYAQMCCNRYHLRICSCLACVYPVMDARGKFGEHERCVRVARGDSRVQL